MQSSLVKGRRYFTDVRRTGSALIPVLEFIKERAAAYPQHLRRLCAVAAGVREGLLDVRLFYPLPGFFISERAGPGFGVQIPFRPRRPDVYLVYIFRIREYHRPLYHVFELPHVA